MFNNSYLKSTGQLWKFTLFFGVFPAIGLILVFLMLQLRDIDANIAAPVVISGLILAILGIATAIPYPSKMISDLGYYTFCPFAPYSTGALLLLAGLAWIVRKHVNSQPA